MLNLSSHIAIDVPASVSVEAQVDIQDILLVTFGAYEAEVLFLDDEQGSNTEVTRYVVPCLAHIHRNKGRTESLSRALRDILAILEDDSQGLFKSSYYHDNQAEELY